MKNIQLGGDQYKDSRELTVTDRTDVSSNGSSDVMQHHQRQPSDDLSDTNRMMDTHSNPHNLKTSAKQVQQIQRVTRTRATSIVQGDQSTAGKPFSRYWHGLNSSSPTRSNGSSSCSSACDHKSVHRSPDHHTHSSHHSHAPPFALGRQSRFSMFPAI